MHTLRTPCKPTAQTMADEAKYTKQRAQISLKPFICHLSPRASQSDSCSHLKLNERHAAATCMTRTEFVTQPKRVIRVAAVLANRVVRPKKRRKNRDIPSKPKARHGGKKSRQVQGVMDNNVTVISASLFA